MAHVVLVHDRGSRHSVRNQLQAQRTRKAVKAALLAQGHRVTELAATTALAHVVRALRPQVAFSLATGSGTKNQQANVIAVLETTGVPVVSSPLPGHVFGLHKPVAKLLFAAAGVPTLPFVVHDEGGRTLLRLGQLAFPVIVKPAHEGSSLGIDATSVVSDPAELQPVVDRVIHAFRQPALVESFVSGREFTVGLVGNFGKGRQPEVLPIEEIVFQNGDGAYTYDVKSRDAVTPVCPAQIDEELTARIRDMCLMAFRACGCRDLARIDVRLSEEGRPFVLEINTLPGLEPGYSELPRMAEAAGWGFNGLITRIVQACLLRGWRQ